MRFPFFLLTLASLPLTLTLAATACSSSSSCIEPPGPPAVATLQAPCGLTITSAAVTGPCEKFGTASMPEVEGTGGGTCDVRATLSNGAMATGSVTFTASSCGQLTPSTGTVDLEGAACDAGAPADATPG